MSRPSVMTCIIIAASVSLVIIVFTIFQESLEVQWDYAHNKAGEYWDKAFSQPQQNNSNSESDSNSVHNCEDPYRRPGYLYIPADINGTDQYKKTQWIPFNDELLSAEAPDYAVYPAAGDVIFNATEPESAFVDLASTPKQWLPLAIAESNRRKKAVNVKDAGVDAFAPMKDEGGFGWLWGRRIILFSDSVDRFMMQYFCGEFKRGMKQPKPHTLASCEIPEFNLTFSHWHFAGSMTYRPEWWWMDDMEEISFEERWDKYWVPLHDSVRGPNGRPDLILWQNGLWDQRAFWESGEANHEKDVYPMGVRVRQLVWQEVRFAAARIRKFVERIHTEFGDAPVMFRSMTMHRMSDATDASIYDLERLARATAEKAGHEVFEWGRLISSLSMLYKDKTHPGKGPASWLWGNMVLEYLARIGGAGDESRKPYFDGAYILPSLQYRSWLRKAAKDHQMTLSANLSDNEFCGLSVDILLVMMPNIQFLRLGPYEVQYVDFFLPRSAKIESLRCLSISEPMIKSCPQLESFIFHGSYHGSSSRSIILLLRNSLSPCQKTLRYLEIYRRVSSILDSDKTEITGSFEDFTSLETLVLGIYVSLAEFTASLSWADAKPLKSQFLDWLPPSIQTVIIDSVPMLLYEPMCALAEASKQGLFPKLRRFTQYSVKEMKPFSQDSLRHLNKDCQITFRVYGRAFFDD
ncbi:hypothetical protein F53441_7754 [Fusarium austroafricanum]|uniref:Uncharacterized protein n=1 Tax=Fusarium austroafricanum TaxID=2364996 RepID=A0A8H4P5G4_9HYPO|nr:hypothetical protein F53441_7754 [Fusarium austroafricanum]